MFDWLGDFFGGFGDFFGGSGGGIFSGFGFDFFGDGSFFGGVVDAVSDAGSWVSGLFDAGQVLPGFSDMNKLGGSPFDFLGGGKPGGMFAGIDKGQLLGSAAMGLYQNYRDDKRIDAERDMVRERGLIESQLLSQRTGEQQKMDQINFGSIQQNMAPGYSFRGAPADLMSSRSAAPAPALQQAARQAESQMPVSSRREFQDQVNSNPLTANKKYI